MTAEEPRGHGAQRGHAPFRIEAARLARLREGADLERRVRRVVREELDAVLHAAPPTRWDRPAPLAWPAAARERGRVESPAVVALTLVGRAMFLLAAPTFLASIGGLILERLVLALAAAGILASIALAIGGLLFRVLAATEH